MHVIADKPHPLAHAHLAANLRNVYQSRAPAPPTKERMLMNGAGHETMFIIM